jgi:hypothetical protein
MTHLDSADQLRRTILSLHATYAEGLNTQLKLLSNAKDHNSQKAKDGLRQTIILFAIFSRELDEGPPLTENQQIGIAKEIADAYGFPPKYHTLIQATLDFVRKYKQESRAHHSSMPASCGVVRSNDSHSVF